MHRVLNTTKLIWYFLLQSLLLLLDVVLALETLLLYLLTFMIVLMCVVVGARWHMGKVQTWYLRMFIWDSLVAQLLAGWRMQLHQQSSRVALHRVVISSLEDSESAASRGRVNPPETQEQNYSNN